MPDLARFKRELTVLINVCSLENLSNLLPPKGGSFPVPGMTGAEYTAGLQRLLPPSAWPRQLLGGLKVSGDLRRVYLVSCNPYKEETAVGLSGQPPIPLPPKGGSIPEDIGDFTIDLDPEVLLDPQGRDPHA